MNSRCRMRWTYAQALYEHATRHATPRRSPPSTRTNAPLEDVVFDAGNVSRIALRVFGGAHPLTTLEGIESRRELLEAPRSGVRRESRDAALRGARERL